MSNGMVLNRTWSVGFACVAALALSLAGQAGAQDGWLKDGLPMKKQANTATSGSFGVMQITTSDPDRLVADWLIPTPGVTIRTASQTPRNKPIATFIVFKGCGPDRSGNCNVTADYKTVDPAGKSYDHTKGGKVWVGYPPPEGDSLQLSSGAYILVFEDKDRLGAYRVRATITDHVLHKTLRTEQIIDVVAR